MSALRELLPAGDVLGAAGPEAAELLMVTVRRSTLAGDTLSVAARGPVVGICDSRGHFWYHHSSDEVWEAPNANALAAHADTITVTFGAATAENEMIAVRIAPEAKAAAAGGTQ